MKHKTKIIVFGTIAAFTCFYYVQAEDPPTCETPDGYSIEVTGQYGSPYYGNSIQGVSSAEFVWQDQSIVLWFSCEAWKEDPENGWYKWGPGAEWNCSIGPSVSWTGVEPSMIYEWSSVDADITFDGPGTYTINGDNSGWSNCTGDCSSSISGGSSNFTIKIYTPTPTPTLTPTPTPTPTPNPDLILSDPGSNTRYISVVPAMPNSSETECKAHVENYNGGEVEFSWSYTISYTSPYTSYGVIEKTFTGKSYAINSDETTWYPNFGSDFYGGHVTISVNALGLTRTLTNHYLILGQQPSDSTVKNYVDSSPWYAKRIAKHESDGYNQFAPNSYPLTSGDGGIGIMQLTPPSANNQYWNWKSNVDRGESIIDSKQTDADIFTANQINQWLEYNDLNDPDVPEPAATTYNDITFALYMGSSKPYHDANGIKAYNSASSYFMVWIEPQWVKKELNNQGFNYVKRVCDTNP